MAAHGEQTAVILGRLVLEQRGVIHRDEVMCVPDEHLHSVAALHQLQVLQQVIDRLARFPALHDDAALGVLDDLRLAMLQNFPTFVRGSLLLRAEFRGDDPQLVGRLDLHVLSDGYTAFTSAV